VNGIHTGVERATYEKIVLADDDVRYDADSLRAVIDFLDQYEVVRPQNFLSPLSWCGRMEAARMLINRATLRAADYPGTCGFRRSAMLRAGHFDGDVLFDNEEMIRHFVRSGLTFLYANDLFVRKEAPAWSKWLEQRARQAYEDFPLRLKTILFSSLIPLGLTIAAVLGRRGLLNFVVGLCLGAIALALAGYTRGEARKVFPWSTCLYAPLWVIERALSTYCAFYCYVRRGGYPFGDTLLSKGVGQDWIDGGRIASRQLREQS
jgi:cellulose synthase/poly-beta-1,6-N-acetylglucosamine synthase-like glycosyltransferase